MTAVQVRLADAGGHQSQTRNVTHSMHNSTKNRSNLSKRLLSNLKKPWYGLCVALVALWVYECFSPSRMDMRCLSLAQRP